MRKKIPRPNKSPEKCVAACLRLNRSPSQPTPQEKSIRPLCKKIAAISAINAAATYSILMINFVASSIIRPSAPYMAAEAPSAAKLTTVKIGSGAKLP